MSDDDEIPALAADLARALGLLQASDRFYHDLLEGLRDTVAESGDADLPELVARLNRALTEFAPWDREIRRLLDRYRA